MMAYGKVYDTLLGGKNESLIKKEWQAAYDDRVRKINHQLDQARAAM